MGDRLTQIPDGGQGSEFPVGVVPQQDALVKAASSREIAEAQGAMLLAQRFPRDEAGATERILIACQRPGLAEGAMYTYARGGTNITGPSIRLAEAIAQTWGNLTFGIRELEQRRGESTMEAFAWDLERNVRQIKVFQVRHVRHAKGKIYPLETPRDIYEAVANQGARRMRACILGLIPGDIVEAAVSECEKTLTAQADLSPEGLKKMLGAFEKYGVTKKQIEARLDRKLDAMTAAQMVGLQKLYNSMRDGMSVASEWFEPSDSDKAEAEAQGGVAGAKEALKKQGAEKTEPAGEAAVEAEAKPEPATPAEAPAEAVPEAPAEVRVPAAEAEESAVLHELEGEMRRCFAPDGDAAERWLKHGFGSDIARIGQLSASQAAVAVGKLSSVKDGALKGWTKPAGKGEKTASEGPATKGGMFDE